MELREYVLPNGKQPFSEWLMGLDDRQTRARIRTRLERLAMGNLGDFKPVGGGIFELRFTLGPGYRVYFGREGQAIVLLLCGDDKSTQTADIARAQDYWNDYQARR